MKKRYLILGIIAGIFISGFRIYANILSSDIDYDNSKSKLSATKMQAALDEVYLNAANAKNCTGYDFDGWYTDNTYTTKANYNNLYDENGNQVLYPKFVPKMYTVTINVNDLSYGTVSNGSVTVPYGTTYSVSESTLSFSNGTNVIASPTSLAGYNTIFSSWSQTSGTITGATTITAIFNRTKNYFTGTKTSGKWIAYYSNGNIYDCYNTTCDSGCYCTDCNNSVDTFCYQRHSTVCCTGSTSRTYNWYSPSVNRGFSDNGGGLPASGVTE